MNQKNSKAAAPVQPVVQPPRDVILAAFTRRELEQIRGILRDSDSESAVRLLNQALARAGK